MSGGRLNEVMVLDADDDDIPESDVSDDELESVIQPNSFVDYLYFRYEPMINKFFRDYGPALKKTQNYASLAGLFARKALWKISTSFIVYALPIMLISEREQIWNAEKRAKAVEADSAMLIKPPSGAEGNAGLSGDSQSIAMIPPPSS
eukprot:CAMPEP_0185278820 /NCGR_PEP_ID=MMETSP1359-20130426/61965_1 /TAXON_ID=552665 /ORGANISM="Bigelowiella longifila, Strain CCMP242" /LENGTH=147 /DNA_ID=CAMNT_0027873465 /DNA_START=184 /DNA_END=630 /DNA_ORIENTATION=-